MNLPKLLGDELFNLLVPIDNETKGWELAGAITDDSLFLNRVPQQECLEASEGRANSQIDLLPHTDSLSQVAVRWL